MRLLHYLRSLCPRRRPWTDEYLIPRDWVIRDRRGAIQMILIGGWE